MSTVGGGRARRIGALSSLVLMLVVGAPYAGLASGAPQACARLLLHPVRPAVGERTLLLVELLGPSPSPSPGAGSRAGGTSVLIRASISGPDAQTLGLSIQQSQFQSRVFRSHFRVDRAGPWHVRVLVFAASQVKRGSGDPLCYASRRFDAVRPHPAPVVSEHDRGGLPNLVLPILGSIPILLGLGLLAMSGRRRARKRSARSEPATVPERDAPTAPAGR